MNIQELKDLISNSQLPAKEKKRLSKLIDEQGMLPEVVNAVKDAVQNEIDGTYEKLGIKIDTSDPQYQAKHKEMTDEIAAAEEELAKTTADIQTQIYQAQEDTQQALDKIEADIAVEDAQK